MIPPVVAVLLWKTFYDGSSAGVFNTVLGWVAPRAVPVAAVAASMAMPSLVLEATWANAGATVIIYLAALTGVNAELYEAASVDGAVALAEGLARHAAAAPRRAARDDDPADHRDGAGVPRAVPLHLGRAGNATLTVLLLIYNYAFGNSLGGDYGSATALSLMLAGFLALFSLVYLRAHALVEHGMIRRRARTASRETRRRLDLAAEWTRVASSGASARYSCSSSSGCSSSASARSSGLPSPRSRRPPTRSATRCRSSRTAPRGATCSRAWTEVHVGRYFWNTVVLAFGSWARADRRRDDRRVRAVGAPAVVCGHRHARSCS